MPTYPRGPRLVKGALVTLGPASTVRQVIVFQYNPEKLTRRFQPQYIGGQQGDQADGVRFQGAPIETISLTVHIDAIDQLETGSASSQLVGIHPQLAALELLVSPSVSEIKTEIQKLSQGTIEILPALAPLTVFVFGVNRIVPVRVDEVSVEEETHDSALNPIRAAVSLSLRVMTYSDQDPSLPGFQVYMNYQSGKELLSSQAYVSLSKGLPGSLAGSL
jgi:hypothetical protein